MSYQTEGYGSALGGNSVQSILETLRESATLFDLRFNLFCFQF